MKFEVDENYYKYSLWQKIWEVIKGLLTLLYLPFAFASHLLSKLHGKEEPVLREQNVWQLHINFNKYKVESFALSNEETALLIDSETLAFPDWKDWDDPFRFLLRFRSQPGIEELRDSFFDEIDLKTSEGIYLIRINNKGEGMTLCFLPSIEPRLIEIVNLKSLCWNMNELRSGTIELSAYSDEGMYHKEIKLLTGIDKNQ